MAYPINPVANLRATTQNRIVAIGAVDDGLGAQVGLFEFVQGGWTGIWTTTPLLPNDFTAAVEGAGGVLKWLDLIAKTINAKLREMFIAPASAPVLSGSNTFEQVINELNANWQLTIGADGVPVFGKK